MIRPIQSHDIQAVADIYNHYIIHTTVSFEEQPVTAEELAGRIDKIRQAGFAWLVAEDAGQIVGYAYAGYFHHRAAYRHTAEITVYLSHRHIGGGWGSKLYEALFASLRSTPVHAVIGVITLPNPASIALHEKFGMTRVGYLTEVGRKFDQWIDVGFWQGRVN
jgi:phosphinothricin acetyltransferase